MNPISLILLALAMSTDAFAAAIGKGSSLHKPRLTEALRAGLIFGVIEAITPMIGWAIGHAATRWVENWDHWIAFGLLAWIGGKMVHSGFTALRARASCPCPSVDPTAGRNLLVLSVATSIDALAVGLSFAILGTQVWGPSLIIGVVCAFITAAGVYLGKTLANLCAVNGWAELLGGLTLLAIACNTLREHNVFG